MNTFRKLLFSGWIGISAWSCTHHQPALKRLYIVQLGPDVPAGKLALMQRQLRTSYGVPVQVLPAVPLPDSAFYAPRQRYRAQALLNHLAALQLLPPNVPAKLIALTKADVEVRLSAQKPHWGVMGLADGIGGQQAVISLHRLAGKDSRLRNVAVHETGHLLGLRHCGGPDKDRCVMRDAEGSGAVVDRCSLNFCAVCMRKRG